MKRRLSSRGQIVIPKELREDLGWREGEELTFRRSPEGLVLSGSESPKEFIERFLETPGKKLRKRIDLKALLDEEYRVPR